MVKRSFVPHLTFQPFSLLTNQLMPFLYPGRVTFQFIEGLAKLPRFAVRDPELIAFFSKRRAAIEAELARRGQSGGRAAERANFATRAVKVARPRAELFAEWQRIGHEHHWSAKELSWMIDAAFPARRVEWERAAASTEALAQLTASQSHFCRRQIVQAVAECSQGRGLGAEVVLRLSQELLQSSELVRLGEYHGEVHYTTREILA